MKDVQAGNSFSLQVLPSREVKNMSEENLDSLLLRADLGNFIKLLNSLHLGHSICK